MSQNLPPISKKKSDPGEFPQGHICRLMQETFAELQGSAEGLAKPRVVIGEVEVAAAKLDRAILLLTFVMDRVSQIVDVFPSPTVRPEAVDRHASFKKCAGLVAIIYDHWNKEYQFSHTMSELGSMLGLDRSSVWRQLNTLEKDGWIVLNRRDDLAPNSSLDITASPRLIGHFQHVKLGANAASEKSSQEVQK